MTITVFGASGAIGRLLITNCLNHGYNVRAYVRNSTTFEVKHELLEVIEGNLNEFEKIKKVVTGADVVISTLGPPLKRNYTLFSVLEGHVNIVKAMENGTSKRFITIATPSVKSTEDYPSLTTKMPTIMAKLLFTSAYKEIVQVGEVVQNSSLDWTIVRFIAPNNSPQSGKTKVTFGKTKISWGISRADIAEFLFQQINETKYIRSMPIIGQ